jgi:hypothetical protein
MYERLITDVARKRRLQEGFFVGKVVDNKDPMLLNRVKVEIEELSKGVDKEILPWYVVIYPPADTFNNKASIPPIGSYVRVEFPSNDFYNGIVTGMISRVPPDLA